MLRGLHEAHVATDPDDGRAIGVVHRDVSPHNVMVDGVGHVKVIDFGLATSVVKQTVTESAVVLGKTAYMAPEQARGEQATAATHQYAAAIVLYELVTGERFYGDMASRAIWSVAGAGQHRPRALERVPTAVRTALVRALTAAPKKRFPSCAAFADALVQALPAATQPATTTQLGALVAALSGPEQDTVEAARAQPAARLPAPARQGRRRRHRRYQRPRAGSARARRPHAGGARARRRRRRRRRRAWGHRRPGRRGPRRARRRADHRDDDQRDDTNTTTTTAPTVSASTAAPTNSASTAALLSATAPAPAKTARPEPPARADRKAVRGQMQPDAVKLLGPLFAVLGLVAGAAPAAAAPAMTQRPAVLRPLDAVARPEVGGRSRGRGRRSAGARPRTRACPSRTSARAAACRAATAPHTEGASPRRRTARQAACATAFELRIRFYQPKTRKAYGVVLRGFLSWLGAPPAVTTRESVRDWLELLVDGGATSSWVSVHLSCLRTVFDKMCGRRFTLGLSTPGRCARRTPRRRRARGRGQRRRGWAPAGRAPARAAHSGRGAASTACRGRRSAGWSHPYIRRTRKFMQDFFAPTPSPRRRSPRIPEDVRRTARGQPTHDTVQARRSPPMATSTTSPTTQPSTALPTGEDGVTTDR